MGRIESINLEDFAHPLDLHIVCSYFVHVTYYWIFVFTGQDFLHARRLSEILHSEFPGFIEQTDIQ